MYRSCASGWYPSMPKQDDNLRHNWRLLADRELIDGILRDFDYGWSILGKVADKQGSASICSQGSLSAARLAVFSEALQHISADRIARATGIARSTVLYALGAARSGGFQGRDEGKQG